MAEGCDSSETVSKEWITPGITQSSAFKEKKSTIGRMWQNAWIEVKNTKCRQ